MFKVASINKVSRRQYRRYSHADLTNAFKEVVENGTSVYKASRMFSVPEQTLRDRLSAKVDIITTSSGPQPLLSQLEEARLSDHVTFMASIGYGYTRSEVTSLATDYAISVGKKTKGDASFSMQWFYGFLKRWPELKVTKPKTLSELRAYATSEEKVSNYFTELDKVMTKYDLKSRPENIYNVDEKGMSQVHTPPYVVGSAKSTPIEISAERSSTVTLLGCGNALGHHIPPYFVFQGARMREELLDGATPGADGTVSESGWSNSAIFEHYLQSHFLRYAQGSNHGKILLMYDGHKSHISPHLIDWANAHNIILFVLPPHTSHVLQPMDVGCFGPFSKIYQNECHKWQRQNPGTVNRYNICSIACKAYALALSQSNLRSAFRKCGISPFDPNAIDISYLQPSKFVQTQKSPDNTDHEDNPHKNGVISSNNVDDPTDNISTQQLDFFADRLPIIQTTRDKTRKPRRSLNKVVAGKAITETDVAASVNKYIAESTQKRGKSKISGKSTSCKKTKGSSVPKRKVDERQTKSCKKGKKKKTTKQTTVTENSPRPGPSGIDRLLISDDESFGDTDGDILDEEKCCVCKLFQPVELHSCVSVVFTKWGQCMFEECKHWVHLKYCCDVRVLRTHDIFYCPCHGLPCKQEE